MMLNPATSLIVYHNGFMPRFQSFYNPDLLWANMKMPREDGHQGVVGFAINRWCRKINLELAVLFFDQVLFSAGNHFNVNNHSLKILKKFNTGPES